MGKENFKREKLKILFYMLIYDLLCWSISIPAIGLNGQFVIGLLAGSVTAAVNLYVLEKVVDCAIEGKKAILAFLIHLGRFLLFALAGYFCFTTGMTALVSWGIGTLGLTAASAAVYIH